jgi:ArsR family transcriptional regulator
MEEMDLDTILAVIGNPTRRRILRKLVKEEHYPLQLSRELSVSQQSIMKHLEVLEQNELVTSVYEKSDSGGPPRRYYTATKNLTIIIDLGPELFSEELRIHGEDERIIEGVADTEALRMADNIRIRLAEFMQSIAGINERLGEMASERDELMAAKKDAMHYANQIIDTLCEDYQERKVLRYLISEDDLSLATMSERLYMRESEIEKVLKKLEELELLIVTK